MRSDIEAQALRDLLNNPGVQSARHTILPTEPTKDEDIDYKETVVCRRAWSVGPFLVRYEDGKDFVEIGTEKLDRKRLIALNNILADAIDAMDEELDRLDRCRGC